MLAVYWSLTSEELTNMYSSLLANSCNATYSKICHPAHSATIKQMSPYDAQMFSVIAKDDGMSAIQYLKESKISNCSDVLYECIPFTEKPFDDIEMQALSVSALKHLGLITYAVDKYHSVPQRFLDSEHYLNLVKFYEHQEFSLSSVRCTIYLTPYGKSFANACSLRHLH